MRGMEKWQSKKSWFNVAINLLLLLGIIFFKVHNHYNGLNNKWLREMWRLSFVWPAYFICPSIFEACPHLYYMSLKFSKNVENVLYAEIILCHWIRFVYFTILPNKYIFLVTAFYRVHCTLYTEHRLSIYMNFDRNFVEHDKVKII